jgi:hypothetical protein
VRRGEYGPKALRFCVALFGVVAAGMLVVAALAIFQRPQTYRSLADHGVRTLAAAHCGRDCELTYTFAGRTHTNRYSNDTDQFQRGAATPVLVDPRNPGTMFTVRDVDRGTNAGVGVFSLLILVMGLFLGGLSIYCFTWLRKLPAPEPPPEPPRWDASPLARSLYATDEVQELLDRAYPLPGSTWFRVDRGELAAGVEEMRSRVAAVPGPRAPAVAAADRVAQAVRAAPRIPLIGGARVRAYDLSEQLDEVRLGVLRAMRDR